MNTDRANKREDGHPLRYITAHTRGAILDRAMADLLKLVLEQWALDVVFVAEFVQGRRIFRHVQSRTDARTIEAGESHPLEDTLCQRIADGRMKALEPDIPALRLSQSLPDYPFPIGTYVGVPVRLADGSLYGTLCGFTLSPISVFTDRDIRRLQVAAASAARLLTHAEGWEAEAA